MAYKLIWSPAARDDLHNIVVFIARDNPNRAMSFGYELISETNRLQEFPEIGGIVPEYRSDYIRQIIIRPYRIVCRVDHTNKVCEIARVWHSARGIPHCNREYASNNFDEKRLPLPAASESLAKTQPGPKWIEVRI